MAAINFNIETKDGRAWAIGKINGKYFKVKTITDHSVVGIYVSNTESFSPWECTYVRLLREEDLLTASERRWTMTNHSFYNQLFLKAVQYYLNESEPKQSYEETTEPQSQE